MTNKATSGLDSGLGTPPQGGSVQIGTIVAYVGVAAPSDWLLCNGTPIPTQYGQLRTLIGGNSPVTPNLTGRTLVGAGTDWVAGTIGGEASHTLSQQEMPAHQHFGWGVNGTNDWGGSTGYSNQAAYTGSGKTDSKNNLFGSTFAGGAITNPIGTTNGQTGTNPGATSPHNNMQPYYVINYIIYAGTN